MAATATQLANLAKARKVRAANLEKKKPSVTAKKKVAKKTDVKKNPEKRAVTAKFGIAITTAGGKKGFVATTAGNTVVSLDTSVDKAKKMLLGQAERVAQSFFDANKRHVRKVAVVALKKPKEDVYRANPVPPSKSLQIKEAADLYEDFTGHKATGVTKTYYDLPKVALQFGECDGIMYTTVRDGVTERYCHTFKKTARPLIAAASDGKSLHLVGGHYRFTNRGIVDN